MDFRVIEGSVKWMKSGKWNEKCIKIVRYVYEECG